MSTLKVSKPFIRKLRQTNDSSQHNSCHKSFNGLTNIVNIDLMLRQLSFNSHFYLPSPIIASYLINIHVMQTVKETIYFNFFSIISIKVFYTFVVVFPCGCTICGLLSPSEPHLYRGVNIMVSISNIQSAYKHSFTVVQEASI